MSVNNGPFIAFSIRRLSFSWLSGFDKYFYRGLHDL